MNKIRKLAAAALASGAVTMAAVACSSTPPKPAAYTCTYEVHSQGVVVYSKLTAKYSLNCAEMKSTIIHDAGPSGTVQASVVTSVPKSDVEVCNNANQGYPVKLTLYAEPAIAKMIAKNACEQFSV